MPQLHAIYPFSFSFCHFCKFFALSNCSLNLFFGVIREFVSDICLALISCNFLKCKIPDQSLVFYKLKQMLSFQCFHFIPLHHRLQTLRMAMKQTCLGIRSQIIPLKLSFAFCVFTCKHFTNSLFFLNSRYIGLILYITSFGSPDPSFYMFVLFALSALNLHQLSGPAGQ